MEQKITGGEKSPGRKFVTLVVGDVAQWRAIGRNLPETDDFLFADVEDLNVSFLHVHAPDIVVSPLVARKFDAIDVARVLEESNYRGPYRAVAGDVPNASLIRDEVSLAAPQIDFEMVELSAIGQRD